MGMLTWQYSKPLFKKEKASSIKKWSKQVHFQSFSNEHIFCNENG